MKRKWVRLLCGLSFLLLAGQVSAQIPKIPIPNLNLLFGWSSLVETPLRFVQTVPYETRTWTFRQPGALSMKIRFKSVDLAIQTDSYADQKSKLEILDGNGKVVQTIVADSTNVFDSVSVTGAVAQIRYTAGANGGSGTMLPDGVGGGADRFEVAGYNYWRLTTLTEGSASPLRYSLYSPLPVPAQPLEIWRFRNCEIPITIKKAFDWSSGTATNMKVDFFLDGVFLGSSAGSPLTGDWNSIYFGVQLDLAQWLAQHGGHSSTLVLRETTYVPGGTPAWRTEYQYLNLPLTMADSRLTGSISMPLEAVSMVTTKVVWVSMTNWGMVHVKCAWNIGGGSPGVDVDLVQENASYQVVNSSTNHGIHESNAGHWEGFNVYLPPGYHGFRMNRASGSCVSFGYTATMSVKYDPGADYIDHYN